MRSEGLIKYDICDLKKKMNPLTPYLWQKGAEERLAKLEAQVPIARRRYLKRLVVVLRNKASIYYPGKGRVFAFESKFAVTEDGRLLLNGEEVDPYLFTGPSGDMITDDSNYS